MRSLQDVERDEGAVRPGPRPAAAPGRGRAVAAGAAGLLTVVLALLLPFAPVAVNEPTVAWPRDPARPESTLLTLTAYRPLELDVRFSCEVARTAAASGGVVVATALPGSPGAGLLVTATEGRLRVRALDRPVLDEPLPAGPCTYRIAGTSAGRPSDVAGPPVPVTRLDPGVPIAPRARDPDATARPGDAELVVLRDGGELARLSAEQLPDVDALVTDARAVPPGDLAVRLRVDDRSTSSPTPLKSALTVAVVVGLLVTAALLVGLDRATALPRARWRWRRPSAADVVVPAVLVAWLLVAPATDDDGYFAAQARNAALSGAVTNYYQFYGQSFVPFTWLYQGLAWWQQVAGYAPVLQRIPALVAGLLTWVVARRITAGRAPWVLAVVFLAWWLPYGMGVRPEAVVALAAAGTLLAVLAAGRARRAFLAWLACAVAGAGFAAHTTGVVVLAPLLAGIPLLRPVLHVPGKRWVTAVRVAAVVSGGTTALLLAFADGALRDFLRGQDVVGSIIGTDDWTGEFERYAFLLDPIPMGSFARRAAVLAALLALAWCAVLAVAARARGAPLPPPLGTAAVTLALAFAALALTPSKWTHHLGALAGIGPVFLALFLVAAVPLARGRPTAAATATAGSVAVVLALSWHGPNSWPYAWLDGVRTPYAPPGVAGVTFDHPLLWLAVTAAAAAALAVSGRARGRAAVLAALPAVVVTSLAATSVYAVGSFGAAAVRGVPAGSVWATSAADPTGCAADGAVRVLDPSTARALPAATADPPVLDGFLAGDGYHAADRPQGAAVEQVWGSFVARDGRSADAATGTAVTGWFGLDPADPTPVAVRAAGTLGEGNALTAVYGTRAGDGVTAVGSEALTDSARSASWRTLPLRPPQGADVVRLEAADATADVNGWLAFTAPARHDVVTLQGLVPPGTPVALGWQLAFAHPCQRPAAVLDGVTEPPAFAVLRGERPLDGLGDVAWQPDRGGVFGQVTRTRWVMQLATVAPVDPYLQVYAFGTPLARDAYTLTRAVRTVPGASTSVR